ncbi:MULTISPECIES: AI-2E family transporter [Aequorivita]|uniref:AI-2E family transporter n=1 Tax=Aequorivita iocasae TaxID=2803865 RepID=A0ABX7DWY0_9FLAO|nr:MULTISPECIES: AI-2E family transporter [Aequorivita]QQX77269.1 AI-2E family transporter [Aequorivita iocasae]UCA56758.1 AI-2E family transporter [Aequorivita sp. F7]
MTNSKIDISGSYLIKTLLIVGGILTLCYVGTSLILPLLVAAIIAVLLDKPTTTFKKWGLPNWLAITLSLVLMIIVFFLLSWLIGSQISNIGNDWPTIKEKASEKLNSLSEWANQRLNWDYQNYIENNKRLVQKAESFATTFLSSVMNLLSQSLIIFVYVVLLLMQKKMFMNFFKKLASNTSGMTSILTESSRIISKYLLGKSKIMIFLFVIYYLGFSLGSVPYALFLALFAALFSIIPYVGNIIGGGIAVILSYLYAGTTPALIVIGVISAAQLLENYVLTPWIIGDETNLNPFITVFGIILFSMLWGMVGAIIALPIIGVLKVIFEHTKGMEPYAYLIKKNE